MDHGKVSCRVAGTDGELVVALDRPVAAEQWHRVLCTRDGDQLELVVTTLGSDGPGEPLTAAASGPIGSVDLAPGTPLSVGGKLGADGAIVTSSSDQLNGRVDRVVVAMAG